MREWLASTPRSLSAIADTVTSWAVLSDASGRTMPRNALREALEESGLTLAGHEWIALLDSVDPDRSGHLAVARAIDFLRAASSEAKRSSDTRLACHALQRAVFAKEDGLERLQTALGRVARGGDEVTRAQLVQCLGDEGIALAPDLEDALVAAATSTAVDGALSAAAVVRLACPDDRDVADMRGAVAGTVSGPAVRQALQAVDTAGTGVLSVREVRHLLIAHGAPLSASQLHALASRHRVPGATAPGPGPCITFMSLLNELGLLTGQGADSQGGGGNSGDPLAPATLSTLPWGLFHPLVRRWLEDTSVPVEVRRAFAKAAGPLGSYAHALVAAGEAGPMPVPAAGASFTVALHDAAHAPPSPAQQQPPPTMIPAQASVLGGAPSAAPVPPPPLPPPPAANAEKGGAGDAASSGHHQQHHQQEPSRARRGPWRCEVCFYNNEASSCACTMCDSSREYAPEKGGPPPAPAAAAVALPARQAPSPMAVADRSSQPTPLSRTKYTPMYGTAAGARFTAGHPGGPVLQTPASAVRSARSALPSGLHTVRGASPSRTHRRHAGSRSERGKERTDRREADRRSRTRHRDRSPHRHGHRESRSHRHHHRHSHRHRHPREPEGSSEGRHSKSHRREYRHTAAATAWE